MTFLKCVKDFYKPILFAVCFFGAIYSTYGALIFYKQTVKHVDSMFATSTSIQKYVSIQIDSDVTSSLAQSVFFARDIVTKDRYKVTQSSTEDIQFGDCLKVIGIVSVPKTLTQDSKDETSSLYVFPYREYLAKDDIYLLLRVKSSNHIYDCPTLSLYKELKLFFMKQKEKLTQIFLIRYEQPYAGFAAGVLVAGKGLLDKDSLDIFKRTSLSHTVVLSGSNISIILVCIKLIVDKLFFWKRKKGLIIEWIQKIIILLSVWIFMLLTGGGAPIYRAVASAYLGMFLFQGKTSQVYALTVTILILTIISPFQTLYDPSFHLTCCATYGLILFSKPIDAWMRFSCVRWIPGWLREIISVTLATQVFVFPYIVYMTSSFSSVFLFSNVLVLPIIPLIMFFGFITLCADIFSLHMLVEVSVYINNICLHLVFYIVKILAHVPYGYFVMKKTTSMLVLIVYGLILSFIFLSSLKKSDKSFLHNTPV